MPDTPISIFISYAHTDSPFVDRLEADLRQQGFDPWVDRQRLVGGVRWRRELQEAVKRAQVLLIVLSPDAVASENVQIEYDYVLELGKVVIPIYYRQCDVPMELRAIQWIDFRHSYEQGLAALLQALRRQQNMAATSSPGTSSELEQPPQQLPDNPSLAPPVVSPVLAPLVDRQHEWAELEQIWQRTSSGHPQLVVLSGEAGAGKTRLAEELFTRVAQQGMTIASAHCYAVESELAYAPVTVWLYADAIRTSLSKLPVLFLTEIARFVPEILVQRPSLPPPGPLTESWQRQRLFEALARCILGARQPLLLLLDDLQWSDRETLNWLHYLLRFDANARLLIVGTLRVEEMTGEHPLESMLTTLRRQGQLSEITLGPLNAAETASLAAQITGRELDPNVLATLFQDTEGNPLFVVETLRMGLTVEGGTEGQFPGETSAPQESRLPPTIQAVIAARLGQLSPEAREVVNAASVIGRAFSFELLAQVSKSEEEALLAVLDELWQRHIVREQGTDAYDFTHGKIREVAYAELHPPRRRLLHRRVAEALEAIYAERLDPVSGQIALHYEQAGALERAIPYYERAAEGAEQLFAHAEALLNYTHALDVLSHLPDSEANRRQRVDTIIKLVRASRMIEDPQRNLERLAEAETLVRSLLGPNGGSNSDRLRLARIHFWMSQAHVTRNAMRDAMRYLQQALTIAEEVGDEELLALTSVQMGRAMIAQGQFGKSKPLLVRAATLLEKVANWPEWIYAAGFLGIALAASGHYVEGEAQGQRALARAQEMKMLTGIALSHICLSTMSFMGGEIAQMLEECRAAVEAAEQSGFRLVLYMGYGFRGWAESRMGNHEAAIQSIEQSKAVAQSLGGKPLLADWLAAAHAEIMFAAGHIEEALALAKQAVSLAQSIGSLFAEGLAHRVWGQALFTLNPTSWNEAEQHFAASLHTLESCEAFPEVARTHLTWGLFCRDRSDTSAALKHFEAAAVQFESAGLTRELERTRKEMAKST